jgi:hypothetical protein
MGIGGILHRANTTHLRFRQGVVWMDMPFWSFARVYPQKNTMEYIANLPIAKGVILHKNGGIRSVGVVVDYRTVVIHLPIRPFCEDI